MSKENHADSSEHISTGGWPKRAKLGGLLFIALLASAWTIFLFYPNPHVVEFNRKTSESVVIGKTPEQIIQLLGKPAFQADLDSSGYQSFTYAGPDAHYCRIDFLAGLAIKSSHWTR